ncbi:efflux transporter outer membrane subunit [Thiomicrospira microaerophila]|uniref:efflux transporter outer membrane subunit n=1 Tax=Thiomicrospira microaerophila TaxID=406020 RepID=UPI00200D8766|nr:efflux transporter outer membrane subunit [Thiomicrospira microaerophila]UQB42883.1 efflux transporter outer membrane subunit [Thiomicrospira microaerophila]
MSLFFSKTSCVTCRTTSRMTSLTAAIALAALATGCSQIPNYQAPQNDLPQHLTFAENLKLDNPLNDQAWWQSFADQQLTKWLEQALANNHDLAVLDQRLVQAQAVLTRGQADRLPNVIGQAGLGRQQTSDNAFPTNQGTTFNSFNLDGLVSYEVDLWGRVRAQQQGLVARYQALASDRQAAQLSLTSAVAQHYFSLQALDEMVLIAQNTVVSRQENLQLRQRQFELGRLTPLAVQQAEVELSRVEVELIRLQAEQDQQRNALSVLLGHKPTQQLAMAQSHPESNTRFIDLTLPPLQLDWDSQRLLQRPDVIAAEQRLQAANADIGQARAALFPSVQLNALFGINSVDLNSLFDSDALQWRVNAGLTAPIFNGGALRAQVQITEAEQQIILLDYQQTLRQAFAETLNAISQLNRADAQLAAQQRQLDALRKTLDLAQKRFDAGYSSYLEVLDAQRALFDAEIAMVRTQRDLRLARIALYKALGGHAQAAT